MNIFPIFLQIIHNACASQAIINLLLNVAADDVKLGTTLDNFKAFTAAFDPALRGLTLGNSKEIRELHNSFAREHYMEVDMVCSLGDHKINSLKIN